MGKGEVRQKNSKKATNKRDNESPVDDERPKKRSKLNDSDNVVIGSKSKHSQEMSSEKPKTMKRQEVILYKQSEHIDFISNIKSFGNMREFLETVFDNKDFSDDLIFESLILLILESCGHNVEDRNTKKLMSMMSDEPSGFDQDNELFELSEDQIIKSKLLDIWNAYISNKDYFIKFKQIFSILGFICIEKISESSYSIVERMIEIFARLLNSSHRIVRFITIVAFDSLFRSITISTDEKEGELELIKRKRSNEAKESKKICEEQLEQLSEITTIYFRRRVFKSNSKSISLISYSKSYFQSRILHKSTCNSRFPNKKFIYSFPIRLLGILDNVIWRISDVEILNYN